MGFKRYGLLLCNACGNGSAHDPSSGIVCSGKGEQSGRSFICECFCRDRISIKGFLTKDINETLNKPLEPDMIKRTLKTKVDLDE